MIRSAVGALCALLLLPVAGPRPAAAQEGDAYVLPRGLVRLQVGGAYTHFGGRFAPGGGSEPLASDLAHPLTASTFAPLRTLDAELRRFLDATAGEPGSSPVAVGPETLLLGNPAVQLAANTRVVPFHLGIGLAPRVELTATLPIAREELFFERLELSGGTVGANPDPAANAALLAAVSAEWAALGGARLLPVAESELGKELQARVERATGGGKLQLPTDTAGVELLNQLLADELGVAGLRTELRPWQVGDAEIGARVQLLNTLGAAALPGDSAVGLNARVAVHAAARLPTGREPDTLRLLSHAPDVGHSGFVVGVDGDLFLGGRFWTTLGARYSRRQAADVLRRPVQPGSPLASAEPARLVRWSPGSELALRVAPRGRLTRSIALGASYEFVARGDGTFEAVDGSGEIPFLSLPGGAVQRIGLEARYTTLPDYLEGRRLIPLEVVLAYRHTLTGPERSPAGRAVLIQASLFQRLWGRR